MGLWDRLRGIDSYDPAQRVLPAGYEPWMGTGGIPIMDPGTPLELYHRSQVDQIWRKQPNVRKVVDFVARNVASIPLHVFERIDDTNRVRLSQHPLARLLDNPRPGIGGFRFWHSVLSDGALYDRWAVFKNRQQDGSMQLVQIPSWRLHMQVDALRQVVAIWVWFGDNTEDRVLPDQDRDGWVQVPMELVVYDHGYAPVGAGLSPLETLSDVLRETAEAIRYRNQVWENGARAPQYIHRPNEAPAWDAPTRDRFLSSLRKFRAEGGSAGGWPLLEDGMEIRGVAQIASVDALDLEGRTLNAVEVASAWHIAPELVGARVANFASLDSFRQMLYRDSLGPYITAWVQAIQTQLVPDMSAGKILYVDPHMEAKLRGSFEEQAKIGQAVVGAPTMTRNEWRARMNQPPIEGGDELVTPLNVVTGGLASPQDTAPPLSGTPGGVKNRVLEAKERPQEHHRRAVQLISRFFSKQGSSVLSRIGAGDADWWDGKRWDTDLTNLLLQLKTMTATEAGRRALQAAGLDADEYDEERTLAYLTEAARRAARSINSTTFDQVRSAIEDEEGDPAHVFEVAKESRSDRAATSVITFAAGFGTVEAARQRAPRSTKTWHVNSGNPRSSHAMLDGETIPLDEDFSNGLPWPGAAGSDADEVAGCQCSVTINIA